MVVGGMQRPGPALPLLNPIPIDAKVVESSARRLEREIRKSIITLDLLPGTALSEQDIARRYGVSRQPVREAFIALARTGLLEVQPQRGTVVVKISTGKMLEARFVREALEVAIVRRACEGFDLPIRKDIDAILRAQEQAAAKAAHYEFQRYDELFHIALAEGAGFPSAWRAIEDIKAHMDRVCHLTLPRASSLSVLIEQHRQIIGAVDDHDSARAEAAMKRHLTEILKALPAVEAQYPDLFE
jgi:DNA-binding GntR family transcriptional regulator